MWTPLQLGQPNVPATWGRGGGRDEEGGINQLLRHGYHLTGLRVCPECSAVERCHCDTMCCADAQPVHNIDVMCYPSITIKLCNCMNYT